MILAVCPFFLPLLSVMSALPLRAPTRADRLRPLRCHKAWVDTGLTRALRRSHTQPPSASALVSVRYLDQASSGVPRSASRLQAGFTIAASCPIASRLKHVLTETESARRRGFGKLGDTSGHARTCPLFVSRLKHVVARARDSRALFAHHRPDVQAAANRSEEAH